MRLRFSRRALLQQLASIPITLSLARTLARRPAGGAAPKRLVIFMQNNGTKRGNFWPAPPTAGGARISAHQPAHPQRALHQRRHDGQRPEGEDEPDSRLARHQRREHHGQPARHRFRANVHGREADAHRRRRAVGRSGVRRSDPGERLEREIGHHRGVRVRGRGSPEEGVRSPRFVLVRRPAEAQLADDRPADGCTRTRFRRPGMRRPRSACSSVRAFSTPSRAICKRSRGGSGRTTTGSSTSTSRPFARRRTSSPGCWPTTGRAPLRRRRATSRPSARPREQRAESRDVRSGHARRDGRARRRGPQVRHHARGQRSARVRRRQVEVGLGEHQHRPPRRHRPSRPSTPWEPRPR